MGKIVVFYPYAELSFICMIPSLRGETDSRTKENPNCNKK